MSLSPGMFLVDVYIFNATSSRVIYCTPAIKKRMDLKKIHPFLWV
jgi:hypothetical protein